MWCQVHRLSTRPASVGPSAGATEMTTALSPITVPRRCGETTFSVTVNSSGIITAVPAAWITRAAMSTQNAGASAAITLPARKSAIDRKYSARVVSRSMRKPEVGITTAMVKRKPVSSHWATSALTPNSAMMAGSATATVVSLKIIIIALSTRMARSTAGFWATRTAAVPGACPQTRAR